MGSSNKRRYCVYMHTSPSGKRYIGITRQNPVTRWQNGRGYTNSPHFFNAINKYGWNSFSHEILYSGLSEKDACEIEMRLIAKYRTQDSRYGYNIRDGGNTTRIADETRAKMSAAHKGKKFSAESRSKMSAAKKGCEPWNKGKKFSDEAREHMRTAQRARKVFKRVMQFSVDGRPLAVYNSVKQASKATGTRRDSISKCIHGKQGSAGGYLWGEVKLYGTA